MNDLNYEVIIIGSGMGGLTAGALLSKNSINTLVLEKHLIPGGYTTTFKRKDYKFDASLHMINGCGENGSVYNILEKTGINISYYKKGDKITPIAPDEVRFIELDSLFRIVDKNLNIDYKIPSDFTKYKETLCKEFPDFESNINDFFEEMDKFTDFVFNFLSSDDSKDRGTPPQRFFTSLQETASSLLNDFGITDPRLLKIITHITGFFALPAEKVSQFIYAVGAFGYNKEGAFQVIGGSGALASAMAETIKKHGGEVKLKSTVDEILIDEAKNKAIGVKLTDGTIYNANYIISNADATHTFNDLIKVSEEYLKSNKRISKFISTINKRKTSLSAMIAYFGLNIDLKKLGFTDYELSFYNQDLSWAEMLEIIETGEFEKNTNLPMTIYSNIDPTCCPEGKSVVSCIALSDINYIKKLLESDGTRGKKYKDYKKKFGNFMVKRISDFLGIPDLDEMVEVMEVATPLTLNRYTNNRNGAFIGWEVTPEQQITNQIPQKTPIKNLYLASAWAMPGGGVSAVIMGGNTVANTILKKKNK
ncbi:MAG: NAD(P)/FAD-dependent oxidoreductase [Promethearchaeota archaeon]|nr:MAG: NAD(P)/FAD-dependent oxidoreductase [Candidatus Lokiarchaeota archaeon]